MLNFFRMSFHDLRPALASREADWIVGMTLGAMSYGMLLILSFSCIDHLQRCPKPITGGRILTQQRVLQGYVGLVWIFNTILQANSASKEYTTISQSCVLHRPWQAHLLLLESFQYFYGTPRDVDRWSLGEYLTPCHGSWLIFITITGLAMLYGSKSTA